MRVNVYFKDHPNTITVEAEFIRIDTDRSPGFIEFREDPISQEKLLYLIPVINVLYIEVL